MNHQNCQHKNATIVRNDTSIERAGMGVLITYHCPLCQRNWTAYYEYADSTMAEIVSREIRKDAIVREAPTKW